MTKIVINGIDYPYTEKSIIIKGLAKPEKCWRCPFCEWLPDASHGCALRGLVRVNDDKAPSKRCPIKEVPVWENTDFWKFTAEHPEADIEPWGSFVGKNDGFAPQGWMVYHENLIYYFGLDGHLSKTKAR